MNISEFLTERYDEIEVDLASHVFSSLSRIHMTKMLVACRAIVEWHKNWPILVETSPEFEMCCDDVLFDYTMAISQRIEWLTQEEYRKKFGSEPPTAPLLKQMAQPYSDHPDFQDEWRV